MHGDIGCVMSECNATLGKGFVIYRLHRVSDNLTTYACGAHHRAVFERMQTRIEVTRIEPACWEDK